MVSDGSEMVCWGIYCSLEDLDYVLGVQRLLVEEYGRGCSYVMNPNPYHIILLSRDGRVTQEKLKSTKGIKSAEIIHVSE